MNYFDYNKVRALIAEHKPKCAAIGMREDWFWTAKTVFENGAFTIEPYQGDIIARHDEYRAELTRRLSVLTDGQERGNARHEVAKQFEDILISGIAGSYWATPQLMLEMEDGSERAFNVTISEGEPEPAPSHHMLGCLSGPAQDFVTQIPLED